jgi:porin
LASTTDRSPIRVGVARTGDYGVYGVIDQVLWRLAGDDPKKGIGAFTRFALSPPDRSLISLYADAGINFIGLWDQRPDDKFGIAASFSSLSPNVRELDLEKALFTQTALPLRNYELVVELTYQALIVEGWTIQPDFQYNIYPGAGAVDLINPLTGVFQTPPFSLRPVISF